MSNQDSNHQESFNVERIRPEGVAVNYDNLNPSQQEAFRRLLYTMEEAVTNLSSYVDSDRRFRPNNVVFISGTRGTGKTCLLHSFMRYTDTRNSYVKEEELEKFYSDSHGNRRRDALNRVRKSIVWLPSIDIDPLPTDFDLVSSVLVRIHSLVEEKLHNPHLDRFDGHRAGGNQVDIDSLFESLLVDAAQAWKGGMIGAETSQEPELFAMVAKSLAEANLNFAQRFRKFLDAVATQFFQKETIFVLPIDDADLKPAIGLSVLKLLRMLHAPRLFVIAMGDINLFELVSSLEMMHEIGFHHQPDQQALLPVSPDNVRRHVASITATAIRKLIPPDQRIELKAWPVDQALEFKPRKAKHSLRYLLKSIPIIFDDHLRPLLRDDKQLPENKSEIDEAKAGKFDLYDNRIIKEEQKVSMGKTLFQLLFPSQGEKWESEFDVAIVPFAQQLAKINRFESQKDIVEEPHGKPEQIRYLGAYLLQSSARRIADIWFSMRRLQASTSRIISELSKEEPDFINESSKYDEKRYLKEIRKSVVKKLKLAGRDQTSIADKKRKESIIFPKYDSLWDEILSIFKKICRQSLIEEEVLSVADREAINRAFDEHADQIDWIHLPLSLRPTWSGGRSSTLKEQQQDESYTRADLMKYAHNGDTNDLVKLAVRWGSALKPLSHSLEKDFPEWKGLAVWDQIIGQDKCEINEKEFNKWKEDVKWEKLAEWEKHVKWKELVDWKKLANALADEFCLKADREELDAENNKSLDLTTGATVRFNFTTPQMWTVETASTKQVATDVRNAQLQRKDQFNSFKHRPISLDTAAAVALYHDLLQFSPKGELFHSSFINMSVYEGLPWAYTEYEIGPGNKCNLYWPAPPCVTVYGMDYFAHLWKQMTDKKMKYDIRPERFALAWITFGCAMINSSIVQRSVLEILTSSGSYDIDNEHNILKGNLDDFYMKCYRMGGVKIEEVVNALDVEGKIAIDNILESSKKVPSQKETGLKIFIEESQLKFEKVQLNYIEKIEKGKMTQLKKKELSCEKIKTGLTLILRMKFFQYLISHADYENNLSKENLEQIKKQFSIEKPSNFDILNTDFMKKSFPLSKTPDSNATEQKIIRKRKELIYEEVRVLELCYHTRIHLNRCAEKAMRLLEDRPDSDVGKNYREWLLNSISLVMPEFGFNGDLRRNLLFESHEENDHLLKFIQEHRRAIRGRRAKRLAKLVWLGLPHLAIRLAYSDPNLYGRLTRLTKRSFFRAFHFVHQDHSELQSGMLWYNDDQRISEMAITKTIQEILGSNPLKAKTTADRDKLNAITHLLQSTTESRSLQAYDFDKRTKDGASAEDGFLKVIGKAAESQAYWDSSSYQHLTQLTRCQFLKRLWWIETTEPPDSNSPSKNERTYLLKDEYDKQTKQMNDSWEKGRGLTPSIEEIENAGITIYGAENWKKVSLRQFSYDLDFAEESYFSHE